MFFVSNKTQFRKTVAIIIFILIGCFYLYLKLVHDDSKSKDITSNPQDIIMDTIKEKESLKYIKNHLMNSEFNNYNDRFVDSIIQSDWIDPTDMFNFNGLETRKVNSPSLENMDRKPLSRHLINDEKFLSTMNNICNNKLSANDIIMHRWLKILLNELENSWDRNIHFSFSEDDLNKMREIVNKDKLKLSELEISLSNVINSNKNIFGNFLNLSFIMKYREQLIILVILIVIFFSFCIVLRNPYLTLLLFVFMICLYWSYMHLYQKKIAEKHYVLESKNHPLECRNSELGYFHHIQIWLKSWFTGKTDCSKYYLALMTDPFWEVNLSEALIYTLTNCIFYTMVLFGENANKTIKAFFSGLEYFHIIILIVIFMVKSKYGLKLAYGLIEITPYVKNCICDTIQGNKPSLLYRIISKIPLINLLTSNEHNEPKILSESKNHNSIKSNLLLKNGNEPVITLPSNLNLEVNLRTKNDNEQMTNFPLNLNLPTIKQKFSPNVSKQNDFSFQSNYNKIRFRNSIRKKSKFSTMFLKQNRETSQSLPTLKSK